MRERGFLEAGFRGVAVLGAVLGVGTLVVGLLVLTFGSDPLPLLGMSAFVLASSAGCWLMSRLVRE